MRIILSRKGFDSAAGGYPSPYFKDSNTLLSFPIPDDYSKHTYQDIYHNDDETYFDLMKQLGIKGYDKQYAHLDPDIYDQAIKNRHRDFRGIFGQCSSSQSHLINRKVEKGDLFLFYGWFQEVIKTNKGYQYIKGTDKHIIWGYLQIKEIEAIKKKNTYEEWKIHHPHYYVNQDRDKNTAYISRKTLKFAPQLPGYGVFTYHDDLVLTEENSKKRSLWKLPKFFHPDYGTKMSYHENISRWKLMEDGCLLENVPRGQEFVIEGNENIIEWAKGLFQYV